MSTSRPVPPLIVLVDRAQRALHEDMASGAREHGFPEVRPVHNAVFATLAADGSRISEMAAQAGVTKQTLGELVRELAAAGIVEVGPDPTDGRAKLVRYTAYGWQVVRRGKGYIDETTRLLRETLGSERYDALCSALDEAARLLQERSEART